MEKSSVFIQMNICCLLKLLFFSQWSIASGCNVPNIFTDLNICHVNLCFSFQTLAKEHTELFYMAEGTGDYGIDWEIMQNSVMTSSELGPPQDNTEVLCDMTGS